MDKDTNVDNTTMTSLGTKHYLGQQTKHIRTSNILNQKKKTNQIGLLKYELIWKFGRCQKKFGDKIIDLKSSLADTNKRKKNAIKFQWRLIVA